MPVDYLSLTDLFLVGLALDVVGAVVLAKGLLTPPVKIYRLSATYVGSNPTAAYDRIEARVAAEFGLTYLAGGFLFQVIGYGAEVAGVETATGICRFVVAVILAGAVACIASLAWSRLHPGRAQSLADNVVKETEAEEARSREAINAERVEKGLKPLDNG